MADLPAFLERHQQLVWSWGSVDCSLVLADWAIENGHSDPASSLRGTYSTAQEWKNIITSHGGLLPLVSDLCDRAGIVPTAELTVGTIAVIGSPLNIERQWGAIYDGSGWLIRGESSFSPLTAHALGKWRV